MEMVINNVVLMFSPTDEKTIYYEQGENRTLWALRRASIS